MLLLAYALTLSYFEPFLKEFFLLLLEILIDFVYLLGRHILIDLLALMNLHLFYHFVCHLRLKLLLKLLVLSSLLYLLIAHLLQGLIAFCPGLILLIYDKLDSITQFIFMLATNLILGKD